MKDLAGLSVSEQAAVEAQRPWLDDYCRQHKLRLEAPYLEVLYRVGSWIVAEKPLASPMTLGISGAQGSGKSTLSRLLAELLNREFGLTSLVLSMDDFYHRRDYRQQLAREVHPLLATRGVPGSHDVGLMRRVLADLSLGLATKIPVFDKAIDDRSSTEISVLKQPQVIIMEGWCWGIRPCDPDELLSPVNELEALEDASGHWRHYVNEQIKNYQTLFAVDKTIFLKVPGFESVLAWRWQQEQGLKPGSQKMTESEVHRFVMFYERLTLRLLEQMPVSADLTLGLDLEHRFSRLVF